MAAKDILLHVVTILTTQGSEIMGGGLPGRVNNVYDKKIIDALVDKINKEIESK